jgi:hypothetical protein
MIINKRIPPNIYGKRAEDRAHWEWMDGVRRGLCEKRGPLEVVMIHTAEGKTQDIVTGIPPVFGAEARSVWAKRREEVEIDRLFK